MIYRVVLGLICVIISVGLAAPKPLSDDDLTDIVRNGPHEESVLVKRRIFEDSADNKLKQISLSALVGDVENQIFTSALSFNKILIKKELKGNNTNHSLTEMEENTDSAISDTTTTSELTGTTEIVEEEAKGVPTHLVIDRIAIKPNTQELTLIPLFEVKLNETNGDANQDHDDVINDETTTANSASADISTIISNTTTTTTTENVLKSETTPKNIEQLKEAEAELKEKFAEIEAEPIILSARV